jgi:exportin-T
MIICLGDELLQYVPVAVSLLLSDCKSQDIQEFIPFINQLITKYKERISPFLQTVFMQVVQAIMTCLSQPFDSNDLEALRDYQSLQRCYFLFLNSIATNNITEVIAKGCNNLEEVLGTLVQGAVSFPDPAVQKLCFGVLKRLIDLWGMLQRNVFPVTEDATMTCLQLHSTRRCHAWVCGLYVQEYSSSMFPCTTKVYI